MKYHIFINPTKKFRRWTSATAGVQRLNLGWIWTGFYG